MLQGAQNMYVLTFGVGQKKQPVPWHWLEWRPWKYFNNHDIKVNECELPFSYTLKVHIIQFMHNLQNLNLGYRDSTMTVLFLSFVFTLHETLNYKEQEVISF